MGALDIDGHEYDHYDVYDIEPDTEHVIYRRRDRKQMKTSGVVSKTYEKPWDGRNGPITLHSFQLEGDSKYYRTGEAKLFKEGDSVEFEFAQNGNVDVDTVKEVERPANPAPKSAPRQAGSSGSQTASGFSRGGSSGGGYKANAAAKEKYWEDKEQRQIEVVEPRITWSSAQSDAVALVTAALQHDIISFGNANKGAKFGLLMGFVDQATKRFATQRWNAAKLLQDAIDTEETVQALGSEAGSMGDKDLG